MPHLLPLRLLLAADYNCVRMIDISIPESYWPTSPPPAVAAVGICDREALCQGRLGGYGCDESGFGAYSGLLWGPTDIEIVYENTSDASTFQAYITDSRNGCVRRYSRSAGTVETYEPAVFNICGRERLPSDFPTYVAADATDISSTFVPRLYVAYTEQGSIRYHDPGGMSDTLAAKDANNRCGKQHTVRLAAEEPRGSAALQLW